MAKRKSDKKRKSRRRVLCGGTDTDTAATDAATTDKESGFMGSLFSTGSTPAVDAAEVEKPAADTAEVEKPAADAAVVMATTFKSKKATAKKGKKGKKENKSQKCKTKSGNCMKWFKLKKNKLCASSE